MNTEAPHKSRSTNVWWRLPKRSSNLPLKLGKICGSLKTHDKIQLPNGNGRNELFLKTSLEAYLCIVCRANYM